MFCLLRRGREVWRAGFVVRCDFPVAGTHEFNGFRFRESAAYRFAAADAAFYAKGGVKVVHSVVRMSRRDFDLHAKRRECRSPDCPWWGSVVAREPSRGPSQVQS